MARSELQRLAEGGIGAFPPSAFRDLALVCHESAVAHASARLFVVEEVAEALAAVWEPHEAFSSAAREQLDEVLATQLPFILDEVDESAAVSLASSLREQVSLIIANAR